METRSIFDEGRFASATRRGVPLLTVGVPGILQTKLDA
jgi:hypothetical protein